MLSYRHSYHAGNFADVLKHIVLTEIIQYLTKKDKPFDYIDTHAGAGLYDLSSNAATKLGEYKQGIGRLNSLDYPEVSKYFAVIESLNLNPAKLNHYPGSPYLALSLMRASDRANLHELHVKDHKALKQLINESDFAADVEVEKSDGFDGMLRLLPPKSRRALILIDPSYEVKAEYHRMIESVLKAHKKFPTGVFAIWYPVVDRARITQIDNILFKRGIKDVTRFELGLSADSNEKGMTASGMWVINPPWGLLEKMQSVLPKLKKDLSDSGESDSEVFYRCEVLVGE